MTLFNFDGTLLLQFTYSDTIFSIYASYFKIEVKSSVILIINHTPCCGALRCQVTHDGSLYTSGFISLAKDYWAASRTGKGT